MIIINYTIASNQSFRSKSHTSIFFFNPFQHCEYTAESKTKSHTECISEVKRGSIKPGGRDRWEGDSLLVPDTPTSYLRGCSIINVSYWVEVSNQSMPVGNNLRHCQKNLSLFVRSISD